MGSKTEVDRSLTGELSKAFTAGASVIAVPGAIVAGVDFLVNGFHESLNRELGGAAVFVSVLMWAITQLMLRHGMLPTGENKR